LIDCFGIFLKFEFQLEKFPRKEKDFYRKMVGNNFAGLPVCRFAGLVGGFDLKINCCFFQLFNIFNFIVSNQLEIMFSGTREIEEDHLYDFDAT
jgi:hypothetical protein